MVLRVLSVDGFKEKPKCLASVILQFKQEYCGEGTKKLLYVVLYRVSQELRSLLRDLIPELILSQKRHIHMGPIRKRFRRYEFLKHSK